jgi:hypothetical protein
MPHQSTRRRTVVVDCARASDFNDGWALKPGYADELRTIAMLEIISMCFGLVSAGIFAAHAYDMFQNA